MILVIGGKNQGKTDFVNSNFEGKRVLNRFHEAVRECMEKGEDISALVDEAMKYDVVISDEIGCGVVPIDKFERAWREETGRALCLIAERADAVYRLCAGIAIKIK
ncbi:MAG: bifunctional adenosylcobinamide kinase/adenosylcobinamide-phosphate guanylyltransferase [Clostridiales bacterium]|nr:bifunctional adenosylcobinamide kinase/adenosylcobinamide-phosphate guanylyltransferase [Clostridiales bacterium]